MCPKGHEGVQKEAIGFGRGGCTKSPGVGSMWRDTVWQWSTRDANWPLIWRMAYVSGLSSPRLELPPQCNHRACCGCDSAGWVALSRFPRKYAHASPDAKLVCLNTCGILIFVPSASQLFNQQRTPAHRNQLPSFATMDHPLLCMQSSSCQFVGGNGNGPRASRCSECKARREQYRANEELASRGECTTANCL